MRPPSKPSPLVRRLLEGPAVAAHETALEMAPAADARPARRARLWDLEDKHHCPIIGTCLGMDELVRLAKRFRFVSSLRDEFSLHVEAVSQSHTRNPVSEAIQRLLDRKYAAQIAAFTRLKTDPEVRQRWQDCLARGEVASAMWAVCTHRACSTATRQQMYGDIHMLSHQVGAGQAADVRRLAFLEKENADLKQAQKKADGEFKARLAALQRENAGLGARLEAALAQAGLGEESSRRLAAFESGQAMVEMGRRLVALQESHDQLAAAARRAWDLEKTLKAAQEELSRFARERDEAVAGQQALERALAAVAPDEACANASDETCAGCAEALSSRCILYVGGRNGMIAQYRQLADRLGVRLVHHDGGQEESLSRLPELILGADAVVCPTDQVSHSAYFQVKSHCKRVGKPCLFYQGTGVSSFATAMGRVSRGEFSVA